MARKKVKAQPTPEVIAPVQDQLITDTIEKNYMPYVMSVIVSRAIPEIDGFKPAHRKILYTMYKMGLMHGARTKSANVVGQTMHVNPHGDMAIYETLVRLTRANEALLHPFVDSKGSFGKQYSRDMAFSAPRYTEVKLDPFCAELFAGIEKNAVEMVPNYDNTMVEPTLLPTTFPNILVSPNMGIAVGMASQICSFNLAEICDGTIALLKNPKTSIEKILDLIKAPDFSGGAQLIYDRDQMREIYQTGRGSVRLRSRYEYDKQNSCIDIVQIPYSTSIEAILKSVGDLVRDGKVKEITDYRDEIDLNGFKLTLDIRRGTDPDALMARLFKLTPLEDTFSCNFNVLIDGAPRQMGVIEILTEWIRFRRTCLVRELSFELGKKKDKLHLLRGLGKILLDIDKAIRIVRETEKESDVVPNLMSGFHIDEIQAEYIAEIKLRHLNREYIIERIKEIESLQQEIARLEEIIGDELKQKAMIAAQLTEIKKKYGKPRKTQLVYADDIADVPTEPVVENYPVRVVLTRDGYFKKITHQSLRGSDEQRLKEGDVILCSEDTENRAELLIFTNHAQAYKAKLDDFDTTKASALGEYLPASLNFEDGEYPIMLKALTEYNPKHNIVFLFENGKGIRVPLSAYETKTNRKKLTGAFSSASPIVAAVYESEPVDLLLLSDAGRAILIRSTLVPQKATRTAGGVTLFTLKAGQKLKEVFHGEAISQIDGASKCKKIKIPATGVALSAADFGKKQLTLQ